MATDFSKLLHEAEKLTADIEGTAELPRVERSLRQVLDASNELYTRVAQSGAKDIQANLLLGSKGTDLPRIVQKLDVISSKRILEPLEPVDFNDITTCLENEIRNVILSVVEEEHKKCVQTIHEQTWEHLNGEWKQEKRKILNAMIAPSSSFLQMDRQADLLFEVSTGASVVLGQQEAVYVNKLIHYNRAVVRGTKRPNLVKVFGAAAEEFKDTKVNDMWEIMKYMSVFPPLPTSGDGLAVRYAPAVLKVLVNQGKKYLEDRYKTYMTSVVNENLNQARRGGVPGTYTLVRSFVGIRLQGDYLGLQDGLIEDRPLWPMVYYCLRSGDISAALHCLKKATVDCRDLISLLELRFNHPDSIELTKAESGTKFQYRRYVRNATDPFKRIVWAVLSCCDVMDEHTEVAKTADDYLWLKLSLTRITGDKDDYISYNDLQRTILEEYGECHYDALNQPHLYFQMLALTSQFEAAIEFLARIERYKVHSVHMAIALSELFILGGPRDVSSPLLSIDLMDPKPSRRLNIARLIMIYVQKFETICPTEALEYYFLLRNMRNSDNLSLFMVCVSDLAQETREYEKLFGKIQRNGVRTKGFLDEFTNVNISSEAVAQLVGEQLVKKGLFEDAIDLFDLANNQEEVLNLFCSLFSQVAHLQNQQGSTRERIQIKAAEIAGRYNNQGYKCSASVVTSFMVLRELLIFFDQYHAKQYNLAQKTLIDLQIIPLQPQELDERVTNFKKYNGDVCKVLPDVLLAIMNVLFMQYQKIKGNEYIPSQFQDSTMDKQLVHIREQAKVITNFTGMLPYRMPGDTNSRLVQMEILMH